MGVIHKTNVPLMTAGPMLTIQLVAVYASLQKLNIHARIIRAPKTRPVNTKVPIVTERASRPLPAPPLSVCLAASICVRE